MPNFKVTEQLYSKQGLVYKKQPHEVQYDNWYNSVTNPQKRERQGQPEEYYFYQIHELRSAGFVPEEFGEDRKDRFDASKLKVYPEKTAYSIIRLQDANGAEWLKSKQMWIGMDRLGNEITQGISDPETYEDPQFRYENRRKDPNNPQSPLERKPVPGNGSAKRFTMPFTEENLEKLLSLRPAKELRSVNLVLLKVGPDGQGVGAPYAVESLEDFRKTPFDELYDWLNAPKSKSDTKLGRDRDRQSTGKDNRQYR